MGFLSAVLDILYPPRCVFCRRIVRSAKENICPRCDARLPFTGSSASQKGDFFSACISPLYYEDDVRESLLRFKFNGAAAYADAYGRLIAEYIRTEGGLDFDCISWVPLSRKRYKQRGYDQALLIATAIADEIGTTVISTLEKRVDVAKQSTMGSAEKRRANISGAYTVPDPKLVAGKRILLIDDIITSGSTLSECARMLRQAGAAKVICATVARSRD